MKNKSAPQLIRSFEILMRILIRKSFGRSIPSTELREDPNLTLKMLYFGARRSYLGIGLFMPCDSTAVKRYLTTMNH